MSGKIVSNLTFDQVMKKMEEPKEVCLSGIEIKSLEEKNFVAELFVSLCYLMSLGMKPERISYLLGAMKKTIDEQLL